MDNLVLRGYVTPADFGGDVQAALDYAAKADIRKVIIEEDCESEKTLVIPAYTHLIICAVVKADLACEKHTGYSFEQDRFFLQGKGGKVVGDVYFYNSRRAICEDLTVEGSVTFEYSRDMRMERCTVTGQVRVGRGCANSIFQDLTLGGFAISSEVFCGDIVPAKEPDIKNIVLRDSTMNAGSVTLTACEDCGMFNIQADHITAPEKAVVLGVPGVSLPKERYFNLTFTDLTAPEKLTLHNEVKHMYTEL